VKNEFVSEDMDFLGHVLTWTRVRLDPKNLEAIKC
jgi:hypothetical protein